MTKNTLAVKPEGTPFDVRVWRWSQTFVACVLVSAYFIFGKKDNDDAVPWPDSSPCATGIVFALSSSSGHSNDFCNGQIIPDRKINQKATINSLCSILNIYNCSPWYNGLSFNYFFVETTPHHCLTTTWRTDKSLKMFRVYESKHNDHQRPRYDHIKRFALWEHQKINDHSKMKRMVTHPVNITSWSNNRGKETQRETYIETRTNQLILEYNIRIGDLNCTCWFAIVTARQRSCRKVMFFHLSGCSWGGGGVEGVWSLRGYGPGDRGYTRRP